MDLGIAGRRALVCGASQGLGYACAEALAAEGVAVTLVSRSEERLAAAAARLAESTGRRPAFVVADLSEAAGRAAALAALPDPDILVTNAGGPPSLDFRALGPAHWTAALETNFLAAAELIRATVDAMIGRRFGRIVNVTSLTVRMPVQRLDLSTVPRLALTGYVAGVARQVAPEGVTINNLLPGTIATERIRALGATAEALIARVPMGRAGTPEEFGAACAFLCSRQAAYVTGQNLLVDGGLCPVTV
ncbi:3-oxoacyl-[acyl-carrier protein] reductase [Tistlia consotensis]|uniref:3-oxoacyl-[acyl-carrier protein] reductase n=1 Tax=Tistlia consotensis USBA 355 TaxID=560819 RepID=A0A1Y6BID9_9PROT|nr:SDR family oxidoreductase [Tistlia consotensis]SMF12931.1 3-oxoacyl-[acyl-carrier protein] reductase [Tistlia consotensis USBA 355]SNR50817.1 3-oxoacyl-[acyl-carrier protein] reductase [Tistlia consotensis]